MLATIRDDTGNVLNMQHITPNPKRWDYWDIPGGGHKKIEGPTYTNDKALIIYIYIWIYIYKWQTEIFFYTANIQVLQMAPANIAELKTMCAKSVYISSEFSLRASAHEQNFPDILCHICLN